jgi:hypothetical protein
MVAVPRTGIGEEERVKKQNKKHNLDSERTGSRAFEGGKTLSKIPQLI